MDRPSITPMPPIAGGVGMPWDQAVGDAAATIETARACCGDTFVVDSGADRYLFVFSPAGVRDLYALPEERASKGVADWRMLRRKLPDELFSGRRMIPHELFGKADTQAYLANVHSALASTIDELGVSGKIDVFEFTRRLGHRVGLASWGGPGSSEQPHLDRLINAFDDLDGAEAFVHPDAMAQVTASGKSVEKSALAVLRELLGRSVDGIREEPALIDNHPLFARIAANWSDEPDEVRTIGIVDDVALVHIASMSNLCAAMGWALIDLFENPAARSRVAAGDASWAEQCAMESTRMAQRSIMSRFVLKPITLADGEHVYQIPTGVTVATLLPLTNTSAAPGYETWDPSRWNRRRLANSSALPTVELVTVFGHGKHTCPAQPFSLASMVASMTALASTFEWTCEWTDHPTPVAAQIGGVSRASAPCVASYRKL